MAEYSPWVVKLGGSLDGAGTLKHWIDALTRSDNSPLVVVPGGGVYADLVRERQARVGFDDSTAHAMALLAMDQYGLQIAALARGRLQPARTAADLRRHLDAGVMSLWLPSTWADGESAIARDWTVTSDALALWLAGQLGAAGVALVKSVEVGEGTLAASEAAARGWIDATCARWLAPLSCPVYLLGPSALSLLAAVLSGQKAGALRLL